MLKRILLAGILAVLAAGCTHVRSQAYPGFENLDPAPWRQVRVFWTDPRVEYQPIGEIVIRSCGNCSPSILEDRIRIVVSEMGGNLGLIVSDQSFQSGSVGSGSVHQWRSPSGRPYYTGTGSSVAIHKRDLVVIAAIVKPEG